MEHLRKFGEICKNHYEKVILSLVLIALAWAVVYLYLAGEQEAAKAGQIPTVWKRAQAKPFKPLDLKPTQKAEENLKVHLDLGLPHHLFNPVEWRKLPDGRNTPIRLGTEVGVNSVKIEKITPLYFIMSLDRVNMSGTRPGYEIGITAESAEKENERKRKGTLAYLDERKAYVVGGSTNYYMLREVKGPPEAPTELVFELTDVSGRISLAKDKPYRRPDGFAADFKYPAENKTFTNQRVGATVNFGGDDYKIVAISQTEVVFSARLNEKKHIVKYQPVP